MLDKYIDEQPSVNELLCNCINTGRYSHAYLFVVNGYQNAYEYICSFIKSICCPNNHKCENCNICRLIDENTFSDFKVIETDSMMLKKEMIVELQDYFNTKKLYANKRVYLIKNCEKMNIAASNTLLKFLEEPEEDIIAILVTNNRYKVLETILSRCQIIALSNNEIQLDIIDEINLFVKDLFITKKLIINYDLYLNSLFVDRKKAVESLEIIEQILYNYVNEYSIPKEIEDMLKVKESKIVDYILIIDKEKSKLDYNINMKLWLTNLIAALMEVE